ncbi:MAG: zf-HC2 domain-containing protein, partial [Acidobacteriota bacterium]
MKCRDLQFILPLYSDNVLTEEELSMAERHIDSCPVCRQKLADFQDIRNGLRGVRKPAFSMADMSELKRK